MSGRRITVDARQYRRVLEEAITSLETLDSSNPASEHAQEGDVELLKYCYRQVRRFGETRPPAEPLRDVALPDVKPRDTLKLPGRQTPDSQRTARA